MSDRVLLLMPTQSYRAEDFLAAAERLGVDVIVGTEHPQTLEDAEVRNTLTVDFSKPDEGLRSVLDLAADRPLKAIVGVDDETVVLAAMAAEALGLPHNPVRSARVTRDKYETRRALKAAGLRCPAFRRIRLDEPPERSARQVDYPCVLKPLGLSGSRGVLRADDPDEFVAAVERIAAILDEPDASDRGDTRHLLVEDFLTGGEVALEGLLERGELRVLALFDKPDPLEGPTFEETIYVTPSRLAASLQDTIAQEAARGCRALGLCDGPVHAELRLHRDEPWVLEVAARSIGGLCSRALRFGTGISLEELILRHAVGRQTAGLDRESLAAGVMMIPIPRAGKLREIRGLEHARAVPGIAEVTLSQHAGADLIPLPEGHRYLGFIFARADSPAAVEAALRRSHANLSFTID